MQLCDKEISWFHYNGRPFSQTNEPKVVGVGKLDNGNLAENEEVGVVLVVGGDGCGRGGGEH